MNIINSIRLAALLILIGLSSTSFAETSVIRAGHLIDPATGKVHDNQTIVVENGIILAVGKELDIPPNTKVIDLSDSWVMPGLMDAHVHRPRMENRY